MTRSRCHQERSQRRPAFNVARRIGSQPKEARRLPTGRSRRAPRSARRRPRPRLAAAVRSPHRGSPPPAGLRGDRIDDRRQDRPRHPRAGGLVGGDRRRPEGQGPGAAGLQDRSDRLPGPGDAQPPRPGAGDLAPRPEREDPARARPLSPAPGQAQIGAQESDPLDPDQLRPAPPGRRSVRGRGPQAARARSRSPSRGGETWPPRSS